MSYKGDFHPIYGHLRVIFHFNIYFQISEIFTLHIVLSQSGRGRREAQRAREAERMRREQEADRVAREAVPGPPGARRGSPGRFEESGTDLFRIARWKWTKFSQVFEKRYFHLFIHVSAPTRALEPRGLFAPVGTWRALSGAGLCKVALWT